MNAIRTPAQQLADEYVRRVEEALSDLEPAQRHEVMEQVREHVAGALPADADEVQTRTVLDRLGSPADIAAEARRTFPEQSRPLVQPQREPRTSPLWQDATALVLLLLGGFVFAVGWVVGVVLLWSSRTWNVRQKLLGTLILPLGLAFPVLVGGLALTAESDSCGVAATPVPVPPPLAVQPRSEEEVPDVAPPPAPVPAPVDTTPPELRADDCDDAPVSPWVPALILGGLLLAPIASVSYLGWRRSSAVRADSLSG